MKLTRFFRNVLALGCLCTAMTALSGFAAYADSESEVSQQLPADPPTLWVVGDSTAAEFNDTTYYSPRYGWGTQLGYYFQNIEIRNLAVSGTSSKSFLSTDQYQTLAQNLKAGDYLLIGFGHNDEKAEGDRYTDPNGHIYVPGSFQNYLYEYYIKPATERGANPLLVTPIVRRNRGDNYTGESGHIIEPQTTIEGTFPGGDYANAIRRAAVAKTIPFLDLTARTRDIYQQLNAQGVKNRHAWTSSREISIDNTHTNLYGARYNAWLIADEVLKTNSTLKNYVIPDPQPPVFSAESLNPNYQESTFTAPTGISQIWPTAGSWNPTVFGDIGAYEYMNDLYFTLQPNENSSIRLAAGRLDPPTQRSVGKIAEKSDGIAMYYQAVPADRNFTLSADVTITKLDPNNQASFGLMVRDDIYLDTVINDTLGDYVAAAPLMLGSSESWNCFARKNGVLTPGGKLTRTYREGDSLHLEIKKSSDGYTCTFGDNAPVSAGFDFPLTTRDSGFVYPGLFVSRSADVNFWNISLILE